MIGVGYRLEYMLFVIRILIGRDSHRGGGPFRFHERSRAAHHRALYAEVETCFLCFIIVILYCVTPELSKGFADTKKNLSHTGSTHKKGGSLAASPFL